MSRHQLGFSLPPGAAQDPNAPWNQEEAPCAVCCQDVESCVCHECPVCSEQGNPRCYATSEVGKNGHGLVLSPKQIASRQQVRVAILKERLEEQLMVAMALDEAAGRGEYAS